MSSSSGLYQSSDKLWVVVFSVFCILDPACRLVSQATGLHGSFGNVPSSMAVQQPIGDLTCQPRRHTCPSTRPEDDV